MSKEIILNKSAKPRPISEPYLCVNQVYGEKKTKTQPNRKTNKQKKNQQKNSNWTEPQLKKLENKIKHVSQTTSGVSPIADNTMCK